ncbi:hypothetical protein [Brevibacillus sp. SAFN-007a]|uniref:hypothetical protein n=1 Tax=Brevibacillus sp. SAFN-007a TaxID=3436862 RepID=UPI003F80523A
MRRLPAAFLLVTLLAVFCLSLTHPAEAKGKEPITVSVSVSPASPFHSTLRFPAPHSFVKRLFAAKKVAAFVNPHWVRATLTVNKHSFVYDHDGHLFESNKPLQYLLPTDVQRRIEELVAQVERVHYANATPWEQVKHTFGRMAYATVIDLETGERFLVQRRAGSRHADVQPLTRTDTQTMKNVYQGKWSWKRRAIRVEVNGVSFAASMHGMPHGAGAIAGNDFPGHFCIHFFGSSTHKRKEPDPSHSLMIQKASGSLATTIMGASAEELVGYFLTALHEQDSHVLHMTTDGFTLPARLADVESVRKTEIVIPADERGPLLSEVHVHLTYFTPDHHEKKEEWTFVLRRSTPWDRWRITALDL